MASYFHPSEYFFGIPTCRVGNIQYYRFRGRMYSFGPHWPFSIAMFICILSIGGFFIFAVCRELTWPHYLAGWVCMLTTLYLFWSVLVQECGVLTPFDYQPYQIAPELNRELNKTSHRNSWIYHIFSEILSKIVLICRSSHEINFKISC